MLAEAFASRRSLCSPQIPLSPLLFVAAEGWHKGLLGLHRLAGIVERLRLPTFVSALEPDGLATGSARSIASVDLGEVVRVRRARGTPGERRRARDGGGIQKWSGAEKEVLSGNSCSGHLRSPVAQAGIAPPSRHRRGAVGRGRQSRPSWSCSTAPVPTVLGSSRAALRLCGAPFAPRPPHEGGCISAARLHVLGRRAHRGVRVRVGRYAAWRCFCWNSEGLPLHVAGHLRRTSWQGKESVELLIEDAADPTVAGGS